MSELDEIAKLPRNWDGYDGCTFTPETIDHARRVLAALQSAGVDEIEVAPNPNGTVSLVWRNVAHLEIGRTRGVGYVASNKQED